MKSSRHQAASSNPADFAPGQRWSSETQPELGLALIITADANRVQVHFPATGETMTYASRSAPLRRVAFEPGDTVERQGGEKFIVDSVREDSGRLIYIDKSGAELAESELSDTLSVQRAESRGHLLTYADRPAQIEPGMPLDQVAERPTRDVPLGQVGDALVLGLVEHRHHVGVAHLLCDARLQIEAAPEGVVTGEVGLDQLQRHSLPVRTGGAVHAPHAADAEEGLDPVGAHALPDAVVAARFCPLLVQTRKACAQPLFVFNCRLKRDSR